MKKINFFGVRMDALTMKETLDVCEKFIQSGKPHQHVVVNVAKLVDMQKNKELHDDVTGADLINVDGMGVVWGARLFGNKIPERVAGIDLFANLLTLSERKGYRVYFLGATDEVLKQMVKNIKKNHPKLIIAGYRNGYYDEKEQKSIADNIKKSKAQLLFVGMSSPRKERFIKGQLKNTGVSFAMGVGGSFDIFAGKVKRAPRWVQKAGFEWFYRLVQEPRRLFKRYLYTNSKFALLLVKHAFKRKNK